MKIRILWTGLFILRSCLFTAAFSQEQMSVEQLMKEQEELNEAQKTEYTVATFESTHLIAGHSVEATKKRNLDFRISHRFARMDQGFYDLFGLDNASIRLGLDYGISDKLTVGIGRSSWDKEYDIPVTYKFLNQSTGLSDMPLSLSVMGGLMIKTLKDPTGETSFDERLSTAFQVLVARNFSNLISVQIMPVWIHYVQTPLPGDPNNIFSPGIGASIRISKRVRFNTEYYPLFPGNKLIGTTAPLSFGFDIQTGGHVFQLFISNSIGTNERLLVTQTTDRWDKGQLHFGFNILRVFSLK